MADVVVVARYTGAGQIISTRSLTREQFEQEQTVSPTAESDGTSEVAIVVTLVDENNRTRAIMAAERVLAAIIELGVKLSTPAFWSVLSHGFSSTDTRIDNANHARQIIDVLLNNNGVGGSQRGLVNQLFYAAVVGDPAKPPYDNNYYGNPNLAGGKGIIAQMLHELFHMSAIGDAIFDESVKLWRMEVGNAPDSKEFYNSVYAPNLEAFANEYMYNAAQALGYTQINTTTMAPPGGYSNPVDPKTLYDLRNP